MADDSKRSKLSLPGKPADAPSTERRTRPPLRGSSKPRAPGPGRHRAFDESAESTERRPSADRPARDARPTGDRPRRDSDRPARPAGDRPPRRDSDRAPRESRPGEERRPYAGDRPHRENDRPYSDRPSRPSNGPRREEDRQAYGDRLPREEFRGGAGRGFEERRPYDGERPRRTEERSSYAERPARPAFRENENRRPEPRSADERPRRPSFNQGEERRPYAGDRPHRDDTRAPRPEFSGRDSDRPRYGEQPARRDSERDGHAEERRPRSAFRQDERPAQARPVRQDAPPPRGYGERPRRNIERDGPAPAPTFGDDMPPAAPHGSSFSRSRASATQETHPSHASPEAAPSKPRRPAPPESFANRPSTDTPVDQAGAVRLSKLMSELGLCSRREADDYIERGWVKVDGVVVDELGSKVLPHQHIELLPVAEEIQLRRVTILINKPIGYVSGQAEDGYEPAAALITPENHWIDDPVRRRFEPRLVRKLAPAGRLDIDSTGLLVLTQDGRIAKQLIGEQSDVEKEYLVRVEGELSADGMRLLHHGLELDGVELLPAKVSWQNEDQLRFVLQEGRKRQIRRMCEMVGLKVVGLKRVRIGRIPLSKLPLGQWRYLTEHESF